MRRSHGGLFGLETANPHFMRIHLIIVWRHDRAHHTDPIVAFILTVASVVAVAWKVLHELFVKPRDFKIDLLSEDVARLTRQLESREVRVIAGQGHADESSQIEARPTI